MKENVLINPTLVQARQRQKQEIAAAKTESLLAKLEYVAMMSDIDIDEGEEDNAHQDV